MEFFINGPFYICITKLLPQARVVAIARLDFCTKHFWNTLDMIKSAKYLCGDFKNDFRIQEGNC